MKKDDFLRSLAIGKAFEADAMRELEKMGCQIVHVPKGNFKAYDFLALVKGRLLAFECKYDRFSCINGDVAIEYSCSNKHSGIVSTTANYWLIRACNTFFCISVPTLRRLIAEKKYYRKANGQKTKMYIFRKSFLLDYSRVIKEYESGY